MNDALTITVRNRLCINAKLCRRKDRFHLGFHKNCIVLFQELLHGKTRHACVTRKGTAASNPSLIRFSISDDLIKLRVAAKCLHMGLRHGCDRCRAAPVRFFSCFYSRLYRCPKHADRSGTAGFSHSRGQKNSTSSPAGPRQNARRTGKGSWEGMAISVGSLMIS